MPLLACPWEGCTGAPHPSSRTVRPWGAPLPASALSISEVFTPEVLYPFYVCVLFVGVGHLFVFIDLFFFGD